MSRLKNSEICLFVGMVIYREVKFRDLIDIFVESAKTTGGIMLIVACASLFLQ